MAGKRLNMKNINEVKRLWQLGLKNRQIALATSIHRNTINKYVEQFKNSSDLILPSDSAIDGSPDWCKQVDWEKIREEYLQGVSLNVIHEELIERKQIEVQYAGFWKQVKKRMCLSEATMVRVFKPGERTEIDYADGIEIINPITGEIEKTQFFVGVLCHSRYTFAEFTYTQKSADFLQSHVNMFNYFGGVSQLVSPDNLKSAVTKVHRYDPVINQAYTRLAEHYEIAVVPARVRTPKDKAIVERTIQIFQRYFFMKIRHRTFTSLVELNQCLREHLVVFNKKKHRIFKKSREEMFVNEKPHLRSLPVDYTVATYHRAKLNRDCHLTFENNYYSAPHNLRGQELDIWATTKTIEIFYEGERVAFHGRSRGHCLYVTNNAHYPATHAAYAEEDVQKIIAKAKTVGPETAALIKVLLQDDPYPLRYLQRCRGIIALSWKYTADLLELACFEANRFNNTSLRYIERVIKNKKEVHQRTDIETIQRSHNPHLRGIKNLH